MRHLLGVCAALMAACGSDPSALRAAPVAGDAGEAEAKSVGTVPADGGVSGDSMDAAAAGDAAASVSDEDAGDSGPDLDADAQTDVDADAEASVDADAGPVRASAELVYEKLRTCGAIDEGPFANIVTGDDAFAVCINQCLLDASCEALARVVCSIPAPDVSECMGSCDIADAQTGWKCASDDSYIWPSARCDGLIHCSDRSDEEGCSTFTCTDGTVISAAERCNGSPRCPDESDELGCAVRNCPP